MDKCNEPGPRGSVCPLQEPAEVGTGIVEVALELAIVDFAIVLAIAEVPIVRKVAEIVFDQLSLIIKTKIHLFLEKDKDLKSLVCTSPIKGDKRYL